MNPDVTPMPVRFDVADVESPSYVIDLGLLEDNLRVLAKVQADAGCAILLALKGFAAWRTFPLVRRYLPGIAASSPDEGSRSS